MEVITEFSHSKLKAKGFNDKQIREISAGVELGLDVSIYVDKRYDPDQMYQIRRGLEEGVDVTCYKNPNYPFDKMSVIRNYNLKKMEKSRNAL